LELDEGGDAGLGEGDELGELGVVEGELFGGGLDFDELPCPGHDEIHIDFGGGVFFVAEVEQGDALVDADAGGGDVIAQGGFFEDAGFEELTDGDAEGDIGAGDGSGAGTAVGLDDVAVDGEGALAEGGEVDDGAEAAADEALDFHGAAGLAAFVDLAGGAGDGGAREHGVLGGDPTGTLAAEEGRNAVVDRGGAEHAGMTDRDKHGALGRQKIISMEMNGAKLAGGAAIETRHLAFIPEREA